MKKVWMSLFVAMLFVFCGCAQSKEPQAEPAKSSSTPVPTEALQQTVMPVLTNTPVPTVTPEPTATP